MSTKRFAIPTRRLPTKYYKYTYENWTQPVMSSNYQDGVKLTYANMSSSNIYTLFNGVSNSDYITPTSTTSYDSYVNIAFDYPIKLSNIKINSYVAMNITYGFGECKIVATTKDGQEITISTAKLPDSYAWSDTNFPVDNLIIKNLRIYATSGGNPHPRIGEITLTAQKQTVVESTSSDYDYKVDITKEYILCRKVKQYYKNWVQPAVTSNTSNGTISTTTQHPLHPPYLAFNGNRTGGDKYLSNTTSYGDLTWITPVAIRIKSCKIYTTQEEYLNRYPTSIAIYGSDDGSSWETLGYTAGYAQPSSGGYIEVTCSGKKEYKQTKWVFGANFGGDAGVAIGEIEITAGVSGTKDNYDYYETNIENYILKGK